MTNYQYASNDPIGNIDIDGLEGGIATVVDLGGGVWNTIIKPAAKVAGTTAKAATNLTPLVLRTALTAANTGLRIGLDGQKSLSATDMLRREKFSHSAENSHSSKESKETWGSQESGMTLTSEDVKNGDNAKTHARSGSQGNIDYDVINSVISALSTVGDVAKDFNTLVEEGMEKLNKAKEYHDTFKSKENQTSNSSNTTPQKYKLFKDYKKNTKIYSRGSGEVSKVLNDSTAECCQEGPATDTFPRKKN